MGYRVAINGRGSGFLCFRCRAHSGQWPVGQGVRLVRQRVGLYQPARRSDQAAGRAEVTRARRTVPGVSAVTIEETTTACTEGGAVPRQAQWPAGSVGPVLVAVHGAAPAEEALRCAFAEAEHRGVELLVMLTGYVSPEDNVLQADVVRRWAEKHPEVLVRTTARRCLDPAVVLAAASRSCGLLVVPPPSNPGTRAWVDALSRRARCPVVVACEARLPTRPGPWQGPPSPPERYPSVHPE